MSDNVIAGLSRPAGVLASLSVLIVALRVVAHLAVHQLAILRVQCVLQQKANGLAAVAVAVAEHPVGELAILVVIDADIDDVVFHRLCPLCRPMPDRRGWVVSYLSYQQKGLLIIGPLSIYLVAVVAPIDQGSGHHFAYFHSYAFLVCDLDVAYNPFCLPDCF